MRLALLYKEQWEKEEFKNRKETREGLENEMWFIYL